MDLKSKMTLDISNVIKNLDRVSSQTAKLGKNMSTSFAGAKQSLSDFNTLLKADVKTEGAFKTLKTHASTLANGISASFTDMGKQVLLTTSTLAGRPLRK